MGNTWGLIFCGRWDKNIVLNLTQRLVDIQGKLITWLQEVHNDHVDCHGNQHLAYEMED